MPFVYWSIFDITAPSSRRPLPHPATDQRTRHPKPRTSNQNNMVSEDDMTHLRRCVELAREALEAGDAPFGSVLVDSSGNTLQEDRNRNTTESNLSFHPEFTLALWAERNLTPEQRSKAIMYTSGEHCPMCSSANAYAGLRRVMYVSSTEQLVQWRKELGIEPGPVAPLAIKEVAPGLSVAGPVEELAGEVRELHRLKLEKTKHAS